VRTATRKICRRRAAASARSVTQSLLKGKGRTNRAIRAHEIKTWKLDFSFQRAITLSRF
jgi:hypothetical protein